jgi:very-short-patch-repair endonuclease
MITGWVSHGRLRRLHRGVYAVGAQPLISLSRFRAAVLACGEGAALSHRSAAELWQLRRDYRGPVEVTVPRNRRSRKGIRVYRGDVVVVTKDGIPTTTPGQTIIDIADVLIERSVEQALAIAEREGLVNRADLRPRHGRRGAGVIARLAAAHHLAFTRSGLEEWFVDLIRGSDLPQPLFNHTVHEREVDAYWPEHQLVVEIDSWKYHADPTSFSADRAKDAYLISKGERVLRVTSDQDVLGAIGGALGFYPMQTGP